MFTELTDQEVSRHIHDLCNTRGGSIPIVSAEDCVRRFVRTFANAEMRHEYEQIWKAYPADN